MSITLEEALAKIKASGDNEFKIEFIKRSTGALRLMRCKYTPPPEAIDPSPKQRAAVDTLAARLLNLYDLDDHKFKSIPLEGVRRVEFDGQWFDVLQRSGDDAPSQS